MNIVLMPWLKSAKGPPASAPAGGISDNFNRANGSLGANWTTAEGGCNISSNTALTSNAGHNKVIYSGQACVTVNQYVKITRLDTGTFAEVIFRYTNSSSPFYFLVIGNSGMTWKRIASVGGTETDVESPSSPQLNPGDSLGFTLDGTGTSTVIRYWLNPTGNAPTSATDWGGDTTPDVSFTADPASPVDTGTFLGIGGLDSGCNLDNFFAGDIP